MTICLSMNELDALCRKAARGAGMSWGLAEETGKAVRWLAERNLPGPGALARLLRLPDFSSLPAGITVRGSDWFPRSRVLDPISAGASFSDHAELMADLDELRFHDLVEPLLFCPFLAWTAHRSRRAIRLDLEGSSVIAVPNEGLTIIGDVPHHSSAATVYVVDERAGHQWLTSKVEICELECGVLSALESLAYLTYAPSTESSRLAGAGAGLSDND